MKLLEINKVLASGRIDAGLAAKDMAKFLNLNKPQKKQMMNVIEAGSQAAIEAVFDHKNNQNQSQEQIAKEMLDEMKAQTEFEAIKAKQDKALYDLFKQWVDSQNGGANL
jgi:ABC-type Zn uptake system ZnuABC Zn-binding protein ZnuA